jgi:uncharacterized protein YbjT (DUF2867 family)
VTGATGFVGGRLAGALVERGWDVRGLVRGRARAGSLADRGIELVEGDVLDRDSLRGAGDGVDVAYYLVHSMGRGSKGDFEERERNAARNFAEMASEEGVGRVIYLGGLGDQPRSKHLRSRHRTAEILAEAGPPLTYFRAGMVVGATSESYRTLRYLVQRLPAMIAPAWLAVPTQPIAIDDVTAYLAMAPEVAESIGREIQIGGPDVVTYGEMLDRMAEALGVHPRPRVPVPLLTPWLSSLWIGLVTPVDAAVARPLVEGLSTSTTVTDPSGAALFDVRPISFAEGLRRALAEDRDAPARTEVAVHVLPFEATRPARTGPIGSVERAELTLPPGASITVDRDFVEWAARSYWRFLTRITLGLIRVASHADTVEVVLMVRPLVLLRFRPARYEPAHAGASVTWPIEGGLLVWRQGVNQGHLRLTIEARAGEPTTLLASIDAMDYFPAIRGGGRLAWVGTVVYGATQARVHRLVTTRFLRSLGRLMRRS